MGRFMGTSRALFLFPRGGSGGQGCPFASVPGSAPLVRPGLRWGYTSAMALSAGTEVFLLCFSSHPDVGEITKKARAAWQGAFFFLSGTKTARSGGSQKNRR